MIRAEGVKNQACHIAEKVFFDLLTKVSLPTNPHHTLPGVEIVLKSVLNQ